MPIVIDVILSRQKANCARGDHFKETAMSTTTVSRAGAKSGFWTPWLTMGIVAVVAVAAGILLPQLLPGEMVVQTNQGKADAKDKAKSAYVTPAVPEMPNPQDMLTRLAWGTVLVLGLAAASIWGMRRWVKAHEPTGGGPSVLRLVETLPLGNRCSLHLVQLGNRELLVGVDAGGMKSIVPLPKAFDEVLAETETNEK
jgi:flagellar biogenesis protein FliO